VTIPEALTRDRDFATLLRMATLGATDAERGHIETLVALAFIKGETMGMAKAIEIAKGAACE
jgi:hypothetical protein